jgi:ATP-dependent Clp protease, protease subunit
MYGSRKRKFRTICSKDDDPKIEPELKKMLLGKMLGGDGSEISKFGKDEVTCVDNHIYFYGEVNQDNMATLSRMIKEATKELQITQIIYSMKTPPDLFLHISSLGGDIDPLFGVVDQIESNPVPITTICEGTVASAGTILVCAGHHRQITKNSFMLIHQLASGYWGQMEKLKERMINLEQTMCTLITFYAERTKLKPKQLKKILRKDIEWNAEICLKNGLIDEII